MIRSGSLWSLTLFVYPMFAQAPAAAPAPRVLGAIVSVDPASKQLSIKSDAGDSYTVKLTDTAKIQKIVPGSKDPAPLAFEDIAVGDRAVAYGEISAENKTVGAKRLVIMTKGDLAKKSESEQQDWARRGSSGVVVASKPDANEVVIQTKSMMGAAKDITVAVTPKTAIRQYAPDSVRFQDARPAKLADMTKDDQIRVRGDKSPDGDKIAAEEIVFGTFELSAGTVTSVAENEIKIKDLKSKKTVTVHVTEDSQLRKMPEQMARMLAARQNGEGAVVTRPASATTGNGAPPAGGRPGGGAGGGRGGDMMDRMPKFQLAELKSGDAVMILHTKGAKADEFTAITMMSGVEPILTAPAGRDPMAGMSGMMGEMGGMGGGAGVP
jgi:hypothetical protein